MGRVKAELVRRPGSVFVDVAVEPESARLARKRSGVVVRYAAAPEAPDVEPLVCLGKLCLNDKGEFNAQSKHCQKRAGCRLRMSDWDDKDRAWASRQLLSFLT